ncbi:MAG TPA: thiamine-phosphate kinase [Caulobacteraceae bacterium]|jgi:thiamine-monophosphate kinase
MRRVSNHAPPPVRPSRRPLTRAPQDDEEARLPGNLDEFDFIARVLRPLTQSAPEALGLSDDAAVIPSRPGHELVVTTDAIVEGVHFLPGDPPDLVARKLLRVNLSDLAAKAAEPYGYFLSISWPGTWDVQVRERFAEGLARDQAEFGLKLFGGDTTSTPGPFTASVAALGWAPEGRTVKRSGARPGDLLLVSGTIGDGWLGLLAARGELDDLPDAERDRLAGRYRLPRPRLNLREALRRHAGAATDVSDGLLADAGHIADASGVALWLDLEMLPLSSAAAGWLQRQPDRSTALSALAAGGDDYEVVCTASAGDAHVMIGAAPADAPLTVIGRVEAGQGLEVFRGDAPQSIVRLGWRHS